MTLLDEKLAEQTEAMRRDLDAWEPPTARDVLRHLAKMVELLQAERESIKERNEDE